MTCLSGLAVAQTGNGTAYPPDTGGLFTDVPRDHWAYEDLQYLAERGIITGLPGGQYQGADSLDRYSAAAMIARAIKYLQNNPETVTVQDLNVLKDLIFRNSDELATLQAEIDQRQVGTTSGLETQVAQNARQIAELRAEIDQGSGADLSGLSNRVSANFIISLTALLVGIVAVALATLNI